MEKPKYYKVTSPRAVYRTWNVSLLNEDQLERWNDYKKTDDYKGRSPEEINSRLRQGDQMKVEEWAQQQRMGEIPTDENGAFIESELRRISQPNGHVITVPTYKFKLAKGDNILTESQVKNFDMLKEREIVQKIEYGQSSPSITIEGFLKIKETITAPVRESKEVVVEKEEKTKSSK